MKKAVKNLDDYIAKNQIEILDYNQVYTKSGKFQPDQVLRGWAEKEARALKMGFDGLRLAGNTSWLGKDDWKNFINYEVRVNNIMGQHRIMAFCVYPLDKCSASEIIEVVNNHQGALIKKADKWVVLESSERKAMEQSLGKSEAMYRQVVETLNEGIWAIDKNANTTFVNQRMARMLGYTIEAMLGKSLYDFMDAAGVKIARHNMKRREQGITEQHDFEFLRKDGSRIYTTLETAPMTDAQGNFAGAIAGIIDITRRKQVEQQLKDQKQAIAHKNIVLKELMIQIAEEKNKLAISIGERFEKVVIPKLNRLKQQVEDTHQKSINLIAKNIQNIAGSFGLKLNDRMAGLSPREIDICDLIKDSFSNKTISRELDISVKTVETIRKAIRRKLKIRNKQVSLRAYLQSL